MKKAKYLLPIITIIYITFLIYSSFWTWEEAREHIGWVKNIPQKTNFKTRHLIKYSLLSLLTIFSFTVSFKYSLKKSLLLSFVVSNFLGIFTEVIQYFTPTRIASHMDVFFNLMGTLIGLSFFLVYYFIRCNKF